MMIGIGSDAADEADLEQYNEGEVLAYFTSPTNMWRLYGNNGTVGSTGTQSNSATIRSNIFKIKFTNDRAVGTGLFTLYQLPSANMSDWEDESNVLSTFTIGGGLNLDETNLMPFIFPQNGGSQPFIAVKVE